MSLYMVDAVEEAEQYYKELREEIKALREGVDEGELDENEVAETVYEMDVYPEPIAVMGALSQSKIHDGYTYRVIEYRYHLVRRLLGYWYDEKENVANAYTTERLLEWLDKMIAILDKVIEFVPTWELGDREDWEESQA